MSTLRSCAPGLVLFSLLSLGGPLRAAADSRSPASPAPDPDPKEVSARDAADSLEKAAAKAVSEYRPREAADLYGRAWDVYRDPKYICNQGSLLLSVKRYIEAAAALHTCIEASKGRYGAVSATIDGLFTRARAPICTLTITTNVVGAEISISGKPVGTEPLGKPVFLEAGDYIISATADHYDRASRTAECPPGAWHTVGLELLPSLKPGEVMLAPTPIPKEATVLLTPPRVVMSTDPRANILFPSGGEPSGAAPQGSSRNWLAIVGGGAVAFAGAGIAIGSFAVASKFSSDATDVENGISSRDPLKACNGPTPDYSCGGLDAQRQSAAFLVGLGVAGSVLTAGGLGVMVYGIVSGDSSNRPGSTGLTIKPAPGGGWLGMSGRF